MIELKKGNLLLGDNSNIGVVFNTTDSYYGIYWVWNGELKEHHSNGCINVPRSLFTRHFLKHVSVISL